MVPVILKSILLLCSFAFALSDSTADIVVANKNNNNNNVQQTETFWKQFQRKMQHKVITESIHRHLDLSDKINSYRDLQSNNPDMICEGYNNASTTWECECERFGEADTQVDCTYTVPQCAADNSTCYIGSISQILDPNRMSKVTTTCTTFTTTDDDAETCIRVFPVVSGRYRRLERCTAQYRPTINDKFKACESCTVCGLNEQTNMSEISLDCCNLQTDLKQTCSSVSQTGAALPVWDTITPEEAGMCTSGGVFAATTLISVATFITVLGAFFM